MTNVTIPALPAGTAPSSASPVESVEGGVSVRYTAAQLAALGGTDMVQNQNGATMQKLTNADPGAAAGAEYRLFNGTHTAKVLLTGTGFTPTAITRADGMQLATDGAGGIVVLSLAPLGGIVLATVNTERVQIDANGRVMVRALLNAANDAAAAGLGVPVDGLYRNGSIVMVRVV